MNRPDHLYIDCMAGTAACCRDNLIDLTLEELKTLYDTAPIVIGIGVPNKGNDRFHLGHRIGGRKVFLYFTLAMLVKGGCVFLKDNRCTIYDRRPLMCQAFPLKGKNTLMEDVKTCISCGPGCVNTERKGLKIIECGQLNTKLLKASEDFHNRHVVTLITLKRLVFEGWLSYLKGDPKERKYLDLLVDGASQAQASGEMLWQVIHPEMGQFFEKLFKQENMDLKAFLKRQAELIGQLHGS